MIDLYYWPTPNGHKITMMLEETATPYRLVPVNIQQGEQFAAGFLKIAPNNRMPAIVDAAPADGGDPVTLFESGAILEYLADRTGRFLPASGAARYRVLQWLHWQMAGVGPMFGQAFHFQFHAPEPIAYARTRYGNEVERLLGVLDDELAHHPFIAGDYSIADMAIYPWIVPVEKLGQTLDAFPHVARWRSTIAERPATQRAYEAARTLPPPPPPSEAGRALLYNQQRIRKPGR